MTNKEKLKELLKANREKSIKSTKEMDEGTLEIAPRYLNVSKAKFLEDTLLCTEILFNAICEKVDSLSVKEVNCLLRYFDYVKRLES